MYNYLENIKNDVLTAIDDNYDLSEFSSRDELEERLTEDLWVDDAVTGNASGSYTFSAYAAGLNLAGNFDLLSEALSEFCCDYADAIEKGEEYCDVTIRCYLLGQAISEALDELESAGKLEFECDIE